MPTSDPVIPYRLSDRLYNQRTWYAVMGLWIFVGGGMILRFLGVG